MVRQAYHIEFVYIEHYNMYYIEFVYLNIIMTPAIQYPICVENSRYTERYAGGLCLSNCRNSLRPQTVASGASPSLRTLLIMTGIVCSQNCYIC